MAEPITFAHKPTLTGERVELRPLGPEHVDASMAALAEPASIRLTGTHATFTREQIEHWHATRAEQADRLDFAIVETATDTVVGDLAITELNPDNRSCGYRIAIIEAAVGRGLGTEATRLVLDYVFGLGLHRIDLEVYDFNPRARHVYEKVGFVYEGTQRDALRWDGDWVDAHVMSILETDPRP
ncbi:MAG: GNAT family N-acetyltransferase [Jatrophihabitans sp.]